jgi:hypothetical protein
VLTLFAAVLIASIATYRILERQKARWGVTLAERRSISTVKLGS